MLILTLTRKLQILLKRKLPRSVTKLHLLAPILDVAKKNNILKLWVISILNSAKSAHICATVWFAISSY
ncbi:hypothetical protein SXM_0495 [Shewanella xiamenensis]|nr:hypothetical protein SXM_0495 [Shewanella xiamenensis]